MDPFNSRRKLLSFLSKRSIGFQAPTSKLKRDFLKDSGHYYSTDLKAHFGCVNAVEFSHDDGLLASGGDDRRILVWNISKALTSTCTPSVPVKVDGEHNSNIFCLSFSCDDSLLLSGGNDGCILLHDVQSGKHKDTYLSDEAVYSLASNPLCSTLFAASGHDGKGVLYDTRCDGESCNFYESRESMYAVQYHPVCCQYIATISCKDTARLWDTRYLASPVLKYKYSRGTYNGMSLSFDSRGERLLVIGRRMPPLVYSWFNEKPIHEFFCEGYYCACTIKSCCWSGPNDQYVTVGSDNFKIYLWELPEEATPENYLVRNSSRSLSGHRSIVNQVRYNSTHCCLATSGVEKIVKLWSPFNISHTDDLKMMDAEERRIYTHQEYIEIMLRNGHVMSHNYTDECMEEDPKMIAFFDSIMQRELQVMSDSSEQSEEASQRCYAYEVSSTSGSSTSSPSNQNIERGSSDDDDDGDDNDDDGFGRISPFSEAFITSVVSHHRGELSDHENNTDSTPTTSTTMTQLIAKRKQKDLKCALAEAKRKLKRQQRKEEVANSQVSDPSQRFYNSDSSDESSTDRPPRWKYLRKKRMKKTRDKLGRDDSRYVDELSQTNTTDEGGDILTKNTASDRQTDSVRRERGDIDLRVKTVDTRLSFLKHLRDEDGSSQRTQENKFPTYNNNNNQQQKQQQQQQHTSHMQQTICGDTTSKQSTSNQSTVNEDVSTSCMSNDIKGRDVVNCCAPSETLDESSKPQEHVTFRIVKNTKHRGRQFRKQSSNENDSPS